MKRLLFSDTHLGIHKDNTIWLDIVYNLYLDILDYSIENNIDCIYFLGDFFDNRKSIGIKSLNYAIKIGKEINKSNIPFYMIPGNHDLYNNTSLDLSSLTIFNNFKNIHIINKPTLLYDTDVLVPWNTTSNNFLQGKYLFGHFEIESFLMNNIIECKNGMSPNEFLSYDKVFSGHFHKKSHKKINNTEIIYIGSTYQQNFGDINDNKGFYILENDKLTFIEYTKTPKHKKIIANNDINKKDIYNNIIKLIWKYDYGTIENNKILEMVQSMEPFQLQPDFSQINIEENELNTTTEIKLKNALEILNDYIDIIKIPNHLNKTTLKEMINSLINKGI